MATGAVGGVGHVAVPEGPARTVPGAGGSGKSGTEGRGGGRSITDRVQPAGGAAVPPRPGWTASDQARPLDSHALGPCNVAMGNVRIRVEHALGREQALDRIRRAAEGLTSKGSGYVRSVEWSESGAVVVGESFEGRLEVTEVEVTGEVVLGWKLAFFPLKVQRDAEAWLRELLRAEAGT